MNRRHRLRWMLFAGLGVALALLLGFVALPMAVPTPPRIRVVTMDDYTPSDREAFGHDAPPAPIAQPLPVEEALPERAVETWTRAHDRADWIDGAVVTCDLSAIYGGDTMAFVDMDQGVNLDGSVDVMSRFGSTIDDGRITLTVTETSGTARVSIPEMLKRQDDPPDEEGEPGFSLDNTTVRVRWSGAEPGTTVACDGAWEQPEGRIQVELVDRSGRAVTGAVPPSRQLLVLRGCGVMVPLPDSRLLDELPPLEVETGRCAMLVERRNPSFPLIVSRSDAVLVDVLPGQTVTARITVPDEPPLYQPPDLMELRTAGDMAAFFGSDAAAEAIDDLIKELLNGEWDPDAVKDLLRPGPFNVDDAESVEELGLSDEEVEVIVEQVESGELDSEVLPPALQDEVEERLSR